MYIAILSFRCSSIEYQRKHLLLELTKYPSNVEETSLEKGSLIHMNLFNLETSEININFTKNSDFVHCLLKLCLLKIFSTITLHYM